MRWVAVLLAVLALIAVGAGCGGGDDEAGDDPGITVTETTDTDDTTTDDTTTEETTEETDTDISGDLSGECLEAVQAYSAALAAAGGGTDDSLEVFQEFADQAPEEIRDDFQVLAQAYAEYVKVVGAIDLEPGVVPSADDLQQLNAAAAAFNDPEVTAASERVTAWADENC